MRLLCDEMLRGIGRWLRVAGYDTLIARSGTADADLVAFAQAEGRLFLTCDRELARTISEDPHLVVLASEALDEAARELCERPGIDWLHAPFTRCLLDNASLRPAGEAELARVPASARREDDPIKACPECGRVYWPGSHVRRMRGRLERWAHRA